ncbi:25S rRNA (adenine645-N1)-methyltransferase [Coemansia aciculifera]|uniref:25S rRNA (Adenine645-N1)-methyltransferase n=1 Tax=Coemansia aciculifera TaxID=417176 RepID=A0ACC1M8Y7_9FUNG|nr:25S rRNA (adenine645-N1)-methyltransferase [Coemansia aciculifera]
MKDLNKVDARSKVTKPSPAHARNKLNKVKEASLLAAKREKEEALKSAAKLASGSTAKSENDAGGLSTLQQKMQQKLKGARFRWINEALYTTTGDKALEMVQSDPSIFEEYHSGFSAQVEKWPVNPVDVFIGYLRSKPKRLVVADLGCGAARLSATVGQQHTVHSFDLVAYNDLITPCNIADVPLPDDAVDVAIFCLALMGTDFLKFIREANRILRIGGELKIAEVVSRVSDVDAFVQALEGQGFKLARTDASNKMFIMFDFTKVRRSPAKLREAPGLLKPCIYKRR